MTTFRGVDCFLAIGGGHLDANPAVKLQQAEIAGASVVTLTATTALSGVVMAGDTFTVAAEAGAPVHTVTGGPYVAVANVCGPVSFSTVVAAGGVGIGAVVTLAASSIVEAKAHRFTSTLDVLDTTRFGTSGYKSYIGGLCEWAGTGGANFDYGDARQKALVDRLTGAAPGASTTAVMFGMIASAGHTKQFYGVVAITQFEINAQVAGLVEATYTFRGSGQFTVDWTT
jgi:hypothetical protein